MVIAKLQRTGSQLTSTPGTAGSPRSRVTFDPALKLPPWASVHSSVNVIFQFVSRAPSSSSILYLLHEQIVNSRVIKLILYSCELFSVF